MKASAQNDLPANDILATLAYFSARTIIDAIESTVRQSGNFEIYVSGGGMYNPLLIAHIEKHFSRTIQSTTHLGINPDAKEAVLFALLANETVAGDAETLKGIAGIPPVFMGKISFPR